MKVNLQDFALLHIGTYATTRQLGMGIRKESVLSGKESYTQCHTRCSARYV